MRNPKHRHARRRAAAAMAAIAFGWTAVAGAASTSYTLSDWVDRELAPVVAKEMSTHPRFRGEALRVTVMSGNNPAPRVDDLSDWVRGRVEARLTREDGVMLVAARDPSARRNAVGRGDLRCPLGNAAGYDIGLELTDLGNGRYRLRSRVSDRYTQTWVAGFAHEWTGRLTTAERRRLEETRPVEALRGSRDLPFGETDPDLMAATLAYSMTCDLRGHPLRGVGLYVDGGDDQAELDLVGRYLARTLGVTLASKPDDAALTITGRRHAIQPGLDEFWVSLRPLSPADDEAYSLAGAEAGVYVRGSLAGLPAPAAIPDVVAGVQPAGVSPAVASQPAPVRVGPGAGTLLEPLRLLAPRRRSSCRQRDLPTNGFRVLAPEAPIPDWDCPVLEVGVTRDASAWLLSVDTRRGLARYGRCTGLGKGPLPFGTDGRVHVALAAHGLMAAPPTRKGTEAFYVVAASDPNTRQALARLVNELPERCGRKADRVADDELADWTRRLDALASRGDLDWQALRIDFGDRAETWTKAGDESRYAIR